MNRYFKNDVCDKCIQYIFGVQVLIKNSKYVAVAGKIVWVLISKQNIEC